jgi:hypothetical protein
MPPLEGGDTDDVVGSHTKDNVLEIDIIRVVGRSRVPADIPGGIGAELHRAVKAAGRGPFHRQEPVHVIDLVAGHLMIVHHLVTSQRIFLVNIREGEAIPKVWPGFTRGLVHIAVVGHIVFARISLRARFELLAVLEGVVFDFDDLSRVLARAEFIDDMFGQHVFSFLTISFLEFIARLQLG